MIAFVILHYMTSEDTKEAVNSIRQTVDDENHVIVIVDNASPNGSGRLLEETYQNDSKIKVVLNDENLGFARGNNVGFRVAKNQYNADFIVLMNNDINILSEKIGSKIKNIYTRTHFAVLGPLILSGDGRYDSNPAGKRYRTIEEVQKSITLYESRLKWLKSGLWPIRQKIAALKFKKAEKAPKTDCLQEQENVRLHGSFWVFSPLYIQKYDGIDDTTFMYMEEDILQYRMLKAGMKMLYSPQIVVFHKEGAACSAEIASKEKLIRKYTWLIESNKYFLDLMKNEK